MIGAKVDIRKGWGVDLAKRVNAQIPPKLARASDAGAREASTRSLSRKKTGTMATMELLPIVGTGDGWLGGFKSEAWYARLQSKGFTTRDGGHVDGLHFMEAGRRVARRKLVDELNAL
jgi:hypothetical protein